jgi:hypothetical protein
MASTNILVVLSEKDGSMTRDKLIEHFSIFGATRVNNKLEELVEKGEIRISGDTVILVPTFKAHQTLQRGNVNEDNSIEQTGHNQVSIPYDNTLFRVVNESNELLDEITVDEGMVDLLNAIWIHRIPTFHSCQGEEDDMAWIRFLWRVDVFRFLELVPKSRNADTWKKGFIEAEKHFEISFPPEDIARITEELNSKPIS